MQPAASFKKAPHVIVKNIIMTNNNDEKIDGYALDIGNTAIKIGKIAEDAPDMIGKSYLLKSSFAREISDSTNVCDDVKDIIDGYSKSSFMPVNDKEKIEKFGRKNFKRVDVIKDDEIVNCDDLEFICNRGFDKGTKGEKLISTYKVDAELKNDDYDPKLLEMIYEGWEFGKFYPLRRPLSCIYSSGRTTGTMLMMGTNKTKVFPVINGRLHPGKDYKFGGCHINKYIKNYCDDTFPKLNISMDQVEGIKKKLCTSDTGYRPPVTEECVFDLEVNTEAPAEKKVKWTKKVSNFFKKKNVENDKDKGENDKEDKKDENKPEKWILPDGNSIDIPKKIIGLGHFYTNPKYWKDVPISEDKGLHETIWNVIKSVTVDERRSLCGNVVCGGGSAKLNGLSTNLEQQLHRVGGNSTQWKVIRSPECEYSAWIGASILGSLQNSDQYFKTQADYAEHGENLRYKFAKHH